MVKYLKFKKSTYGLLYSKKQFKSKKNRRG